MTFKVIAGGFELSGDDLSILNTQRSITKKINENFIQVGAVYLKTSSKNPVDENWSQKQYRDVDLQAWIDDETHRFYNVGFNLQMGWVDIDIDAMDPLFNQYILMALDFNGIDTRFRFGRRSMGVATHVMVQLGEDEAALFDKLKSFEPREFRIAGNRYHVQLRSFPGGDNKDGTAKQTVMPGSVYTHKTRPNEPDISVWYNGRGNVADNVAQIAATTPRRVNFNEIIRSIAFGAMLYVIDNEWVEGSRQQTAYTMCGWLARVVNDSQAMNNHEVIAKDVYCPVDSDDIAERLIQFICEAKGDEEVGMRIRTYYDAKEKLGRNPDAKIPGWPAMDKLVGGEKTHALRTVFMPGSDVSVLTTMAERYLYDETDNKYIDRKRFFSGARFVHEGAELERRHKGDIVRVGGKPREAFRLFEASDMRKRVGFRDFYPDLSAGAVVRVTPIGEIVGDEDDGDAGTLTTFNTWRGWPVQPAERIDEALLADITGRLDRVLGYLTRNNADQSNWFKKWVAWTLQFPGTKQQIAPVIVGGQGIGKSWIGNIFTQALFGPLWGSASAKIMEGVFNVGPFKDKMLVFIDEARFQSESGVEEIKRLVRGTDVPGMEKFEEGRNFRIFARLMFASNRFDINVGQINTRDRALFYMRAIDKDYFSISEMEFRKWAETLKPEFDEFTILIRRRDVREHFIRYFMEYPTNRYEVESIQYSSGGEREIVVSNMSWARRVAKHIIEDGRVHEDLDISFPFTISELFRRVAEVAKELGLREIQGARVLHEFEENDVIESVIVGGQRKMRFKHKIATLHEVFGNSIGIKLDERYTFDAADFGPNDNEGKERRPWKGAKKGVVASSF